MQHCFEATAASTANDRIVVALPDRTIVVGTKNEYFVC